MTIKEFLEIKGPVWIRVSRPDSPFYSTIYFKMSKPRRTTEKTIKSMFGDIEFFCYAYFTYTPPAWASPGWAFYFPEKYRKISGWDIRHAAFAQKNWWHRVKKELIFHSIFKGKRQKITI
jgi:hypothetical protein